MTPEAFQKLFERKLTEIKRYAREDLPRHIGKIAVDHFHENFQLGGYVDDTLKPWKPAQRIGRDKTAAAGYGTLLSARKELYNSIRYVASESKTVISSSLRYSRAHNEGATITQAITPQMRKFAWAKYYESGGENEAWKGMAITKKKTRTFKLPKRQFMGQGAALNRLVEQRIHKDLKRILFTN